MSAVLPASSASPVARLGAPDLWSRPFILRAALLLGCVAAGLGAGVLANHAAPAGIEPGLALLLRGMALIKAGITVAAIGLVLWRFGQPVSGPVAAGYIVGVWSLVAPTVLIGYLSYIPAAAFILHVGLFGLLILASRDGRSGWSRKAA